MKYVLIAIAIVVVGLLAYGQIIKMKFVPKVEPICDKRYKVTRQKHEIKYGGQTLYGELYLPDGVEGKLPTLICSHGFNGSYMYYGTYLARVLAMSGFAVYCFDFYAGSNTSKSGGKLTDLSVFDECAQLETVINDVKGLPFVDKENLFLIGESQGGLVTGITAIEHNRDVKAIVLYYPGFCIVDNVRKEYSSYAEIPENPKIIGKTISKSYYEKLYDYDVYGSIVKYENPVLIVHGNADRLVDVSYGEKAAKAYKNACIEILDGEDHSFSAKGKVLAAKKTYEFLAEQVKTEKRR